MIPVGNNMAGDEIWWMVCRFLLWKQCVAIRSTHPAAAGFITNLVEGKCATTKKAKRWGSSVASGWSYQNCVVQLTHTMVPSLAFSSTSVLGPPFPITNIFKWEFRPYADFFSVYLAVVQLVVKCAGYYQQGHKAPIKRSESIYLLLNE